MPLAHVNGIDLYYEVHGQGAPVLLIGGFTSDHMSYSFQVPTLAGEFQCIVFDNRGAGQSSQPDGPYTTAQLADDAADLLDHLGIAKAHIVGHSMGGAIAQEFAINHADKTASVVLSATFPKLDPYSLRQLGVWKQVFRQMDPESYLEYVFYHAFTHRLYAQPGVLEMFKQQALANPYPQTPAGFFGQAAACESHDATARLGLIQAPTLVVAAAEDKMVPVRYALQLAEAIPGADYVELPDAPHMYVWEQPDVATSRLGEWLRGVSR
jgi:pimeloyl-ACP methyl ester carboxylesterase